MTDFSSQFPVSDHCIYLNHAAVAPWPRASSEAVTRFAADNLKNGSLHYPQWLETEQRLRQRAAELINARSPGEIALVKNTSEGISFVAGGLDWQAGDNIVGIQQEFPSNRFAWLSLADRGVEFRELDLEQTDQEMEDALMALCDDRTRLMAVSAVQYASGFRLNLPRLGEFCRQQGILFCVDAIQQLGVLPFDVQETLADFVIADGHKWMLGPEGLGIFFIRQERLESLRLTQFGWHMAQNMGDYTRLDFAPAGDARRFECGSPNMLGIHALDASLGLLLEVGLEQVAALTATHVNTLMERLDAMPEMELLSDQRLDRRSGIITFRPRKKISAELFNHLRQQQVFCAPRGGGIRLSPHFYTPGEHVEQTLSYIEQWQSAV